MTAREAREIRAAKAAALDAVDCYQKPTLGIDCGAAGKAFELMNARDDSIKTTIAKPGLPDNYFHMDGVTARFESKTNGGEITAIFKAVASGKNGWIVYRLSIQNATTSYKLREAPAVLMRYTDFIALAYQAGAIRENSRSTETRKILSIQPSKKAWFEAILNWPCKWEVNREYFAADIPAIPVKF